MTQNNEALKPCPFCGGEAEYDHYGTCMSLGCKNNCCEFDIQLSDSMDIKERLAMKFDENKEGYGYPTDIIERVRLELKLEWNTRAVLTDGGDVERRDLIDNYNYVWRWVERAIWCDDLKDSALSCLKHSPFAPWNDDSIEWDTSHKEYDAEIQALKTPAKPEHDAINALAKLSQHSTNELGTIQATELEEIVLQALTQAQPVDVEELAEFDIETFVGTFRSDYALKKYLTTNGYRIVREDE